MLLRMQISRGIEFKMNYDFIIDSQGQPTKFMLYKNPTRVAINQLYNLHVYAKEYSRSLVFRCL